LKIEKKMDTKRAIYGNSLRARHQLKKLNAATAYPMSNSPKRILNQSIRRRQEDSKQFEDAIASSEENYGSL
jgi:hypothetical protein